MLFELFVFSYAYVTLESHCDRISICYLKSSIFNQHVIYQLIKMKNEISSPLPQGGSLVKLHTIDGVVSK